MPTRIEWCEETWNPLVGCSPVSPGCAHCYAARMASRGLHPDWRGTSIGGQWTGLVRFRRDLLGVPGTWRRPRRVFICSMGDLFHESVLPEWIRAIGDAMRLAPHHTYLILTKRPERAAELVHLLPSSIWLGVSVEDQPHAERIMKLLEVPAARRFVSLEPLLGPVSLSPDWLMMLDWVIAGAETGPRARPAEVRWFRSLLAECQAAPVPFFLKKVNAKGDRELDGRLWDEAPE